MRKSNTTTKLKVQAIAGTYVVVLGWDYPQASCKELLGFSIHRVDHTENESRYLEGMKAFAETDPGFPAGAQYSTKDHPIQGFQWADYAAKPGHQYTYTITALKGTPKNPLTSDSSSVKLTTESPETGDHDVYFNRGSAASQEYARRFGNKRPEDVVNNQAFEWLSRGLYEALESYIRSCKPGKHALRIAAYEFNHRNLLQLIKDKAITEGVDIQIVYDARKAIPGDKNSQMITEYGLNNHCTARTAGKSYISHNKFIVKLKKAGTKWKAESVWTGGTNFSEGGIFGHSNVAHVVEDPVIAEMFHSYWKQLQQNPENPPLKLEVEKLSPLPGAPLPKGTTVLLSPRKTTAALNFYANLALRANQGLFMTFAFGINPLFQNVYKTSAAPFRLALLEKKTRPMAKGPKRDAEEKLIDDLRKMPENVFAIGDFINTGKFDGWVKEKLTGLNRNVNYIHNKFMLIDPLGNDPIVVAGSANFSEASTTKNDENMLIICGNKRVADIYLGEFMRLFSHHSFRESLKWRKPGEQPKPLATNDWWRDYFGTTSRSARRKFFAP